MKLSDVLRSEDKDFSWKNTISKYVFQALKFKKGDFEPGTLDKKTGLPLSNNMEMSSKESLMNGNTQFIFMSDGVYMILISVQQG